MRNHLFIIAICLSFFSIGQKRMYVSGVESSTNQNTLFLVDADSCAASFIGYTPIYFHDIAMNPANNQLYGASFGEIYRIDKTTANVTFVVSTTIEPEGLTFSSDGTLYSTDDGFYICKIDTSDGSHQVIGASFEYAGHDLTFYNCSLLYNRPYPDPSLTPGDPDNFWELEEIIYSADGSYPGKLFYGLATIGCPARIHGVSYSGEIWRFSEDLLLTELICNDSIFPPGTTIGGAAAVYDETNCEFGNIITINMPNVFTPNSDNVNDFFLPKLDEQCGSLPYSLLIFNRWGEIMFETDDISVGWNGMFNDEEANEGTYFWTLEYTIRTGETQQSSGVLQLIR